MWPPAELRLRRPARIEARPRRIHQSVAERADGVEPVLDGRMAAALMIGFPFEQDAVDTMAAHEGAPAADLLDRAQQRLGKMRDANGFAVGDVVAAELQSAPRLARKLDAKPRRG